MTAACAPRLDPLAIRERLDDPSALCERLGIEHRAVRPGRVLARCVWHRPDEHPSMSVRVCDDGTVGAHCYTCARGADALGLVAAVHGLDPRREFARVLTLAAEIAGVAPATTTPAEVRSSRATRSASSRLRYVCDDCGGTRQVSPDAAGRWTCVSCHLHEAQR